MTDTEAKEAYVRAAIEEVIRATGVPDMDFDALTSMVMSLGDLTYGDGVVLGVFLLGQTEYVAGVVTDESSPGWTTP